MAQETVSFVLRFVREVSEEQGARWRGLIQHVQSGAERNFATFADAVQFMQERVVENTLRVLREGEQMAEKEPFSNIVSEMTRMWGDMGPQMVDMWTQTVEQMLNQSGAFRSQVDKAVATTLKAWGLPTAADQEAVLAGLARLSEQLDLLTARVEALEDKLAVSAPPPKSHHVSKRSAQEGDE